MKRLLAVSLVTAVAAAVLAAAAAAHVQVLPANVAPGDPTLFTVLVPNERDHRTIQVSLKVPPGVIPFSFGETPGWRRTEKLKANKSLDVVTWRGALPPGEFVEFTFLATTPDKEGTISWPAVQTYHDGTKVHWIGPPDSEEPAPVTVISKSVAPQNAGGEGGTAAAGRPWPGRRRLLPRRPPLPPTAVRPTRLPWSRSPSAGWRCSPLSRRSCSAAVGAVTRANQETPI